MGLYEYVASAPTNQLDPYGNLLYMQITLIIDMQMAIALDLLVRGYSIQEVAAMTGLPVEKVIMLYLALQRRSRETLDRLRNIGLVILQQVAKNLEARQHARGPLEPGGPGPRGWRPPKPWADAIEQVLERFAPSIVTYGRDTVKGTLELSRVAVEERDHRRRAEELGKNLESVKGDLKYGSSRAMGRPWVCQKRCKERCKGCEDRESRKRCYDKCYNKCIAWND